MDKQEILNKITTELKDKLFDNELKVREFSIELDDSIRRNDKVDRYRDITIQIELDDVIDKL